MLLDHRYERPSDNPLRALVYTAVLGAAFTATVLVYNWAAVKLESPIDRLRISAAFAGDYRDTKGMSSGGGGYNDPSNRLTQSWSRDGCMFGGCGEGPFVVGTRGGNTGGGTAGGCGCQNSVGRKSGPV